jgi:hypothetical protein
MAQDTFPAAASDGFPNFDILKAIAHNEEANLDSYRTTSSKTSSRHQVSAAVSHLAWGLLLGFKAVGPLLETSSTEQNKARRPFNERGKWGQSLSYWGKMRRRRATFEMSTSFLLSTISPCHSLPFSKPCGPRVSLRVFAEVKGALGAKCPRHTSHGGIRASWQKLLNQNNRLSDRPQYFQVIC